MCAACPQNTSAALSPWMSHCMLLNQMVEAGCHFSPNDLSMEEWLGVAELRAAVQVDAMEAAREKRGPPMIGPGPIPITPITMLERE